jgi:Putative auto-transporter adhesin, head GIN domain
LFLGAGDFTRLATGSTVQPQRVRPRKPTCRSDDSAFRRRALAFGRDAFQDGSSSHPEKAMQALKKSHPHCNLILACIAIASIAFAPVATAEETGGTSKWPSLNVFFDLGNHRASFGNNRVKGSGVVKEEGRTVANFSKLTLALPATVTVTQGATESLTISADDNLLPLMFTRVSGDELVIEGDKSQGFSTRNPIRINVGVKALAAIHIKGSGDVFGGRLKSDKLDIAISGSGDIKFKSVIADKLKIGIKGSGDVTIESMEGRSVDAGILGSGDIRLPSLQVANASFSIRGSGDISATGNADKVDIDVMGSGDIRARHLVAREVDARITASGDVHAHATEKLTASVTGAGDIRYAGAPSKVSSTVRGSGTIRAL